MIRAAMRLFVTVSAGLLASNAVAQTTTVFEEPVVLRDSFSGSIQFVSTTGTLRTSPNANEGGNACLVNQGGTDTRTIVGVPTNAGTEIESATLYWAGSHDAVGGGQVAPDFNVTFEGNAITADRQYLARLNSDLTGAVQDYDWFGGVTDVTTIVRNRVSPNGTYSFGGLTVEDGAPQCAVEGVLANWALVIVYSDPGEPNRVVNIFDGLMPFRARSIALNPSNFQTPPNPDGRFGVLTWEGDVGNSQTIGAFAETLQFEGATLTNAQNPTNNQFNSTMSGAGTATPGGSTVFGSDLDVYDISALLDPAGGQTDVTTTYTSGGDLVLLNLQITAIENITVTDLAIDKDDGGASFTVGSTGSYTIDVTNNGAGDVVDTITVTDTLPTGLTFAGFSGTNWSCGNSGQTVTCTAPALAAPNAGLSYPTLTIDVNVVTAPAGGPYVNTASVALPGGAATFDNIAANNSDTESTPVTLVGGDQCYLAGDTGDLLTSVDTGDTDPATNETTIGGFGVPDVETIAWDSANGILYAADADQFGTVNVGTGAYTNIGAFGTADEGSLGTIALTDVDGLAWDARTNTLYGAARVGGADEFVIFQIDPATGAHIDKAFGDPDGDGDLDDYVEIQTVGGLDRHDDIAVDPVTGQMYATAATAQAAPSSLIAVNKFTGAATLRGAMGFDQVQGLDFSASGILYGSVGTDAAGSGRVIRINTATGAGSSAIVVDNADNYEGITCPINSPALGSDLQIDKDVDLATANRGDTLNYTLTLDNNGAGDANAVQVTDNLPAGLTFVAATPSQGVYDQANDIWHLGGVLSGGTATLQIEVTVDASALNPVTNVATITNSSQADAAAANNTDDAVTTLPPAADLVIVKTDSQDPSTINGSLGYMLDVTNNGPDTAINVEVTDTLPGTVTFQSASTSQGSCSESGGTVTCNVGDIANGDSVEINILVTAPPTPGTITNTASVTSDTDDPDPANNTDTEDTQINSNVNQQCYVVADAGGGNGGNDIALIVDTGAATTTAIGTGTGTDNIEAIAYFNDGTTEALFATNAGTFGSIDLATGVFTAIRDVDGGLPAPDGSDGPQAFADIDGLTYDPIRGVVWGAERQGGGPDLLFQINITPPVNPGDLEVGQYIPGVFGGDDYLEIGAIDRDADDIAFDRTTGVMYAALNQGATGDELYTINLTTGAISLVGGITINDTEGLGTDDTGQLWGTNGSGEELLYQVDKTSGVGDNEVVMNIGDDHEAVDCFAISPTASSDLAVTKVVDDAEPSINDTINYTVTVTNNGPSQANAVQIQDVLPAGVTYVDDTPTQGTYDDSNGLWYVGTIANGDSESIVLTVTVDSDRAGQTITNTASVQSSSNPDPNDANDSAAVDINVATPSFLVIKNSQVLSDPINGAVNPKRIPGAIVSYTIGVTNTGNGSPDTDSMRIIDPAIGSVGLLADSTLFVGDGSPGSNPVSFIDGQPSGTASGLTTPLNYAGFGARPDNLPNDDVDFSCNNGADWNCVPLPDADGFATNVTNIRVNPKGQMDGANGGNNPSFQVILRTRID